MANPNSYFALIFPASMSLVFMSVALSTLLKTQESIITQLGYQSPLLLLSPIVTLTILAVKICSPKWWSNLDVELGKKMFLQMVFELVMTFGSAFTIEKSGVRGWDRIFAAFAFSLQFVASSFVTGSSLNSAASFMGGMVLYSGLGFAKETGSWVPGVVASVMFFVVLVGVNIANPPHGAALVQNGGGIKGVKRGESEVKLGASGVKVGETQ